MGKRGKSGEMQKIYQEMSQHLQLQNLFQIQMGKKQLFLLRLKIIIIKVCDVFLRKTKSFFKTQNYLKNLLPHRIYKLNKKLSLFSRKKKKKFCWPEKKKKKKKKKS